MTKEDLEKSEFRVKRMIKRGLGRTTLLDKILNSGANSQMVPEFNALALLI